MTSEICQKYDKRAVYYNKNWRIKYFQNNLNIVAVTSLLNVVIVIFFLYVYNLGYRYHVRVMFSSVVIRKACFIWTFTRILNIQKNNVCNLTNTIGLGLAINKKISISPKNKFLLRLKRCWVPSCSCIWVILGKSKIGRSSNNIESLPKDNPTRNVRGGNRASNFSEKLYSKLMMLFAFNTEYFVPQIISKRNYICTYIYRNRERVHIYI